ncbi:efflux RND transporter periplasmic adaptor subunit [Azonexus hydrophilus]|jgi:Cu(I)/Ag(I) efflux system membrane fusion protein|uniref:Efflux RND transporter periplasmic adaptor subunit n=1 Tax=Azonexus hydrophilus TaxID=418702 RepID=A0ABZ2XLV1_9RHOO|nr:efflux RND transporter periplasmic adaptor subunit [Dechloromonas sp.]
MNKGAGLGIGVIALAIAAGGGYWLGGKGGTSHGETAAPMAAASTEPAKKEKKLLYYRNPMGLPDTSPVPKKDPMGMDYIAVYEGEDDDEPAAANQIKISTEKVQKLGVRTEVAQLRVLDKVVRAAGRIEPDERRIYAISPKFEGYVERLHVNVTGQPVSKGQPLFEVYSPELVSAQREYAIAAQGVESLKEAGGQARDGMKQLADSSLLRLKNWDISEEQVKALAKSGEARRTLTFRSPVSGIVTEKKALQGMRFMPGEALYQVADLSAVWVVADVFEQDIGQVRTGAKAKVRINAYPDKTFEGTISYVYPTLNTQTRTVPVRVELANPGLLLKPSMFAQVELPVGTKGQVVTVPTSAVIDSGARQIVLIQQGEGRFEPREIKLGGRSDNHVEVLEGVKDGEQVVVAANFLIDAESNLKAAVGGFGHAAHGAAPKEGQAVAPGQPAAKGASHQAEGTVDGVDAAAGTISLNHGPVASLKWPAMTMEFKAANASLLQGIKPGAKVAVEFVERQPGEWVITAVKPLPANQGAGTPAAGANPHAGH